MKANDLCVGEVYFVISYEDPGHQFPLIVTYEYVGKNTDGEADEHSENVYSFKFRPSFVPEEELEGYTFQAHFSDIVHALAETHLSTLLDIDGLIDELQQLRRRIREVTGEDTEQTVPADRPKTGAN
jgi:hypothetical protein